MKVSREKTLIALALLGTLALFAVGAAAQSDSTAATAPAPMNHGMMDHGMMLQHLTAKLNLTAEQQTAAKQLGQELHAKMQPLHQAQQQLHTQLQTLLAGANPDPAAVGNLVIQAHQSRAQMKPIFEEYKQKFAALLTPDQQATFQTLVAKHADAFHRHFGGGDATTE
jgi:Spy/CpxP family protein refolding chaperone